MGQGDVDPVGLILSCSNSGIAGLEWRGSRAQRRTCFGIVEGDERLSVGARTQWRIASASIAGGAGDGDVVLAVERDAGYWNGRPARTGQGRGTQIHIGQATCGTLYDDLCVDSFPTCAGKSNRQS